MRRISVQISDGGTSHFCAVPAALLSASVSVRLRSRPEPQPAARIDIYKELIEITR